VQGFWYRCAGDWLLKDFLEFPPQELHTYLKVWYYIIVGEGEKVLDKKHQPKNLPPYEGDFP
jgi:hypothetical protein